MNSPMPSARPSRRRRGMAAARREALETLARLAAPDDAASGRGAAASLLRPGRRTGWWRELPWPEADPALLKAETRDAGGAGARQAARHHRGAGRTPMRRRIFALAEAEENVQRAIAGKPDQEAHPCPGPGRQLRGLSATPRVCRRAVLGGGAAGAGGLRLPAAVRAADRGRWRGEQDLRPSSPRCGSGRCYERFGQLLRRDLQRRLRGYRAGHAGALPAERRACDLGRRGAGLPAGRHDHPRPLHRFRQLEPARPSACRRRRIGALRASRTATIDSFNMPDLQFFAADTSRDAMERRLSSG